MRSCISRPIETCECICRKNVEKGCNAVALSCLKTRKKMSVTFPS